MHDAPPRVPAAGWLLFDTPVGPCGLAWTADGRLAGAQLPSADAAASRARMRRRFGAAAEAAVAPPAVAGWIARLHAVMARGGSADGDAPEAPADRLDDIPLADEGLPDFHRQVWAAARQIPPGRTLSYGQVAQALGQPDAARAVGQALGANPFAPFVPCHRVLAAHGRAGGFSAPGGLRTKAQLLALEGARPGHSDEQPALF